MTPTCDLELDANGEETFWVDKRIISIFSGRLRNICNQSSATSQPKMLKVILHDLPGGPGIFEQIIRFCYNDGRVELTSANACLLNLSAHFMEMTAEVASTQNLVEQTEKYLLGIPFWTWSEVLGALRQCQDHVSLANLSGVLDKLVDSLVCRINSILDASPSNSSPDSSGCRVSFDTRSTLSTKNSSHVSWWFDELVVFKTKVIDSIARRMVSAKISHGVINRFLLYYLKVRVVHCSPAAKRKILQMAIDVLDSVDRESVPCKGLFWILRMSIPLNLSQCLVGKLDTMLGCRIDQATLDNILVPSSTGTDSIYDVDLVLRILRSFLDNGGASSAMRLRRVGSLVDLYLAEVAPDPCLKTQKFFSLAMALPDSARDSHDGLYRAIDIYIEVHSGLSEEQKMSICGVLNYEKLSSNSCQHLAQNPKFPSRSAIQALASQQSRLRNLLQDTGSCKSLENSPRKNHNEQVVLYAQKLDLTTAENEKLKVHLQGMQLKIMELEKICKRMQSQVTKVLRGGSSSRISNSFPKLCR